ncbi:hypothetical protein H0H87_002774 [Tephrocybe sp. NHM501043]|nr:hypothetical protein H0H87_002774 [Tephrocybe sp. NHM501043]
MGNAVEVLKLLERLRDVPVNTENMDTKELSIIYNHLMNVPSSSNGTLHWFCSRASPDIVESATFCIRMFAYESVAPWREKFWACVGHCPECVQILERAKVTSRTTYFGAYDDQVLTAFYDTVDRWELQTVIDDLTKAGLWDGPGPSGQRTLANASPAVTYRMVSNWTIFKDPRIQSIINDRPPPEPLPKWPKDPLPPGMFMLLMHDKTEVRRWAEAQASLSTAAPMPIDDYMGTYLNVFETIGRQLTDQTLNANFSFPFATEPSALWAGFRHALRQFPITALSSPSRPYTDFRGIVARHLYDTGSHFQHILMCLLLLLKRLGPKFWIGESPEFPQVVFDSVKDNRSFTALLQTTNAATDRPWFLAWFAEFMHTIVEDGVYTEVLAKMIDFLCEEAQHERFEHARPLIMLAGTRLVQSVLKKGLAEKNIPRLNALYHALDIHGETFLAVAFARSYDTRNWEHARSAARGLILEILANDVYNVNTTIRDVTDTLAQRLRSGEAEKPTKTKFSSLSIRNSTWKKLFSTVHAADAEGIATLIELVAQGCHIDILNVDHFSHIAKLQSTDNSQTAEATLAEVNKALKDFRDGFSHAIEKITNFNTSSAALDLLRRPGVIKNLMMISLSPVEDVQASAQALVGLAFDVDERPECFRALLENAPREALDGLLDFLVTFKNYAPVMPEACNLSKSLVRCLTDILDVLSAMPNGLLHSIGFLNPSDDKGPAANLMNLWKLMTKSFTVILKRTPSWSRYFENREMVVWMRDALIFGRDMLSTWRVIEQAVNSRETAAVRNSSKLSPVGKEMASGLQEVLFELTRWLRLTDEETLHQSFQLLTSLLTCFRDAGLSPNDETTKRLRRFIESARQNRSDPTQMISRLDPTRLLTLEAALDEFEDVVEIVSPPPSTPLAPKVKASLTGTQEKPKEQRYIMTSKSKASPSLTASSTTSLKTYFKDRDRHKDQQRIDSDIATPAFRKPSKTIPAKSSAGSSRTSVSAPKFEGHASTPQSASSSSESESDSDDEGKAGGLAQLAKMQRSPKIKKPVERRQIMTMDMPVQKNAMQERLARREEIRNAAIRLNPDIGALYTVVLSWDYQHTGDYPPGNRAQYASISPSFADYDSYRKVWEPLLLLDIWAQILSSKQDDQESFDVKVNSRQFSDQWLNVDISFTSSIKKDWYLMDTDLILLKHHNSQKLIMAKVMSYKSTQFGPQQGTQAVIRCLAKNDPGLQMNTTWKLSKIINLTTVQREYASLIAVPYYDHFNTILNPRLPNLPELKEKDVQDIMATYHVNEPQAKAIMSSLRSDGFVLIQGPPGTGKTSTICSLIAASLAKKPQVIFGGRGGSTSKAPTKILLCAPSNAAIDEIAARLHSSKFGGKAPGSIKVVRIGHKQTINASVQDLSLDTLVELKLANDSSCSANSHDTSAQISSLQREIESLKKLKTQKELEKENTHDNGVRRETLMEEISILRKRQTDLVRELNRCRDQNKSKMRDLDGKRRTFMLDVLQESDVICTTLSGAANELLGRFDFEMVIVDEAAQCIELSSLIPLKYRSNRCIMVGDPQQLPPTVISKQVYLDMNQSLYVLTSHFPKACKYNYNESLFVRLQKQRPEAVHLLSIQYRMHPEISSLPSRVFYQGRLLDGPNMAIKTKQPWQLNAKFGTYRFYNVADGVEESSGRMSLKNTAEIRVAVALYARLIQEYSSIDFSYRIGIVSMYRAQIVELKKAFQARFGEQVLDSVDFNTVDGFQGQEKDIIILSCVRSGIGLRTIGFLDDQRRMNVALTRAKSSLFILGNAPTLERSDETWKSIIGDARTRSSLLTTDPTFFTTASVVRTVVPPPPSPVKSSKAPPPPASLPSDLVTPKNFKSMHYSGPSKAQAVMSSDKISQPSQPVHQVPALPPLNTANLTSKTEQTGELEPSSSSRKRLAESVEQSSARVADSESSKPRPPPPKRQKQQANIFIPKPNKKRPPDDAAGGPPTNKRRL